MQTEILTPTPEAVDRAAALIHSGDLVAFPTETVYGLGADALNPEAVERIFEAKGRPGDNPLIAHIADLAALEPLIRGGISPLPRKLAEAFWPGPMTMIFPKSERVPLQVTAGLSTVAVRMPSHPTARALIRAADTPIAAPSANRSGRPSPTTAQHVLEDMQGRIPLIPCEYNFVEVLSADYVAAGRVIVTKTTQAASLTTNRVSVSNRAAVQIFSVKDGSPVSDRIYGMIRRNRDGTSSAVMYPNIKPADLLHRQSAGEAFKGSGLFDFSGEKNVRLDSNYQKM